MKTIGYEICILARKVYQNLNMKFKNYDVTPEQWVILKELSKEDKISQNELAARVEKDKNTVKSIVDKLEKKMYLIREDNLKDKRAFLLILTEKAKNIIKELDFLDKEMINEMSNTIKKEELEIFKKILNIMKNNLN